VVKALRDFLVISRAGIQIASLPTALIGCALAARVRASLWDPCVLVYVLLFFVVLTFACNLNCLTDKDVDARHKKRMSEAVRSLGEKRIKAILAVEAVLALALAGLLAVLKRDAIFWAGAATLGLAFIYSAPPLRIKKRGWLSPLPVAVGLYALPPLGGWYLLRGSLNSAIVLFALGYALLMEGLTIVNTCEDHPEDEAAGVRTLAHALGIRRTLVLGSRLAAIGGIGTVGVIVVTAAGARGGPSLPGGMALIIAGALVIYYGLSVISAARVLGGLARTEDPAAECKLRARLMPAWFLKTRYPLLFIVLLLK
jgi:4-hydroxybenzoate polyprenyltransferase